MDDKELHRLPSSEREVEEFLMGGMIKLHLQKKRKKIACPENKDYYQGRADWEER